MIQNRREPRSPVSKERAMQHALLTTRRAWAGEAPDFERWGGFEIDPEPLVLHDLNGQVLFYQFGVMDGKELVGSIKASASKIIGSTVPTVEFGPRGWDPDKASREAKDKVQKLLPKAKIAGTELVCYGYPRIGVRVDVEDPERGSRSLILDVADLSLVEGFGADGLEGSAAWSFYQEVAERNAPEREQRWEAADAELEVVLSKTPTVFQRALTVAELTQVKEAVMQPWEPEPYRRWVFFQSRTLQFSPRCPDRSHECFALYGQETSWFCAVATGQMILDFHRRYYTQDQIATAMGTIPPNQPPNRPPYHNGGTSNTGQVNGYESLSNNCLNATYDGSASWSEAVAEINENRPLKSGIPQHARACAGWSWLYTNLFTERRLKIYDPWMWNANICQGGAVVWEDWDAVTHTNFIYVRHRTTQHQ